MVCDDDKNKDKCTCKNILFILPPLFGFLFAVLMYILIARDILYRKETLLKIIVYVALIELIFAISYFKKNVLT